MLFYFTLLCIGILVLLLVVVLLQIPDADQPPKDKKIRKVVPSNSNEPNLEEVAAILRLPERHVRQYWTSFKRFDADSSGSVSQAELKAMLVDTIGTSPSDPELERIIRDVDEDGNGTLDFLEFCRVAKMTDIHGEPDENEMKEAFLLWSEGADTITSDTMKHALTTLGDRLTDEEMLEFMKEVDVNQDGTVDFDEFVRAMSWATSSNDIGAEPPVAESAAISIKAARRNGR